MDEGRAAVTQVQRRVIGEITEIPVREESMASNE